MWIATLSLGIPLAWADVVPVGGEPCDLDKNYDKAHCIVCSGPNFQEPDVCKTQHDAARDLACKTSGATVWSEIWCDPGHVAPVAAATAVAPAAKERGCATVSMVPAAAVLLGLVLTRTGRKQRS